MEFRILSGPFAREEGTPSGFSVVSITGEEALSELFTFDVVVLADPELLYHHEEDIEHALLMTDVMLRLGPEGNVRMGMVSELDIEGPYALHETVYTRLRIRVRPRAWLLTQRRNSRIFQHKYLHEIASAILHENGVRHRWDLRKDYPRRIYCTQYEETDYEFLRRILAEEGVYFFFEARHEFEGGQQAEIHHDKNELGEALDHIKKAGSITKSASKEAKNIAKKTGNEAEEGAFDALGGAAGLMGDAADAVGEMFGVEAGEEAPLPRKLGAGEAGPSGNGDVLVFADEAAAYAWGTQEDVRGHALSLTLRDQAGLEGNWYQIDRLAWGYKTRPEHVEIRDYDFRRPLFELKAQVGGHHEEEEEEEGGHGKAKKAGKPMEIYDHHGEYNIEDIGEEAVHLQLEQYRRDARVAHGRGRCARIAPGHRFMLTVHMDHGRELLPHEGDYAVTRVHHQYENPELSRDVDGVVTGCARAIREALVSGRELPENELRQIIRGMGSSGGQPRIYQNRFDCVAADVAFRPPRPKRLVRHVTETATVMGPKNQDIFQDRFGRVKVQFHWDRQGKWDDKTSCWLRVAQPWAGAGYGFQFFPRVGMEVLVTFIGGDTDRPVVVGALYNGTHATPEVLPERMTRSGIRTQTSPKGGGFNELSFEDQSENERIYIHAQRNFEKTIQRDHHVTVGNRHSFSIGGDQRGGVAGDQLFTVGGNRSRTVGGNESVFVDGSRNSRIVGSQTDLVEQVKVSIVNDSSVTRVGMHDLKAVTGQLSVSAKSGASFRVAGTTSDALVAATAYVQGSAYVTVKQRIIMRIQEEEAPAVIRLECGTSVMELHPDRIVLDADDITFTARNKIQSQATKLRSVASEDAGIQADNVVLQSEDQAVVMVRQNVVGIFGAEHAIVRSNGDVQVDAPTIEVRGSAVNFSSTPTPEQDNQITRRAGADPPPDEPPNVTLRFTHHAADASDPIADTRYRVVVGEFVYEGSTNGDGQVEFYAPDDVLYAEVTLLVQESYPDLYQINPLRYTVNLRDELGEPDDEYGLIRRLANLGYEPSHTGPSHTGVQPATVAALRAFQLDHKIPETGEADDTTTEKLREVYGS